MPQLPTSSSATSVPLSYPLYLDLGHCGQIQSKSNYECDNKPNKNMFDLNFFYENILNKSSLYSLNPQYFADSFNYYLNKTYQNGGQHSGSKSFSIESILGFQENNSSPKDFFVNSISPSYRCNNTSNFKHEQLASSPNCHSTDNDLLDSFTLSNEDYSLKDNFCPNVHIASPNGSGDNAIRNKGKSYKLNNSKKSNKIHKQMLHKAANILSAKSKRIRTIFTPEQLERLELEFERQQYMVGTSRLYLASTLNLTEAQVKVWFQNRRIKWRKQHLDEQNDTKSSNQDIDGNSFEDMV